MSTWFQCHRCDAFRGEVRYDCIDDPEVELSTAAKLDGVAVSTVAAPRQNGADDTEGFNEWSLMPLKDGRFLAVMRTGHYTPMVASWSRDGGKPGQNQSTWDWVLALIPIY